MKNIGDDASDNPVLTVFFVWVFKSLPWILIAIFLYSLLPHTHTAHEKARRINCAGNLKQIGLALQIYRERHDGEWPDQGFWQLGDARILTAGKVYRCPSVERDGAFRSAAPCSPESLKSGAEADYRYLGPLNSSVVDGLDSIPIAVDATGNHENWVNILYADGQVKGQSAESWNALRD